MERTTVAIKPDTRARLKAGAASESQTIDAFIRTLLDEHERARFWATFGELTPETYAQSAAADGDDLDESYALEDRAIDDGPRD